MRSASVKAYFNVSGFAARDYYTDTKKPGPFPVRAFKLRQILALGDGVYDLVILEKYDEIGVFPACNRWIADWRCD